MKAHATEFTRDHIVHWREPGAIAQRSFHSCSWCGSIAPADLASALREHGFGKGKMRLHFADMKYGWPHKAYVDNGPDGSWIKFYTEHLQDAEPADREVIQRHLGLRFIFGTDADQDGTRPHSVRWAPYVEPAGAAAPQAAADSEGGAAD